MGKLPDRAQPTTSTPESRGTGNTNINKIRACIRKNRAHLLLSLKCAHRSFASCRVEYWIKVRRGWKSVP
uniref:Uncharacterized protein n=1 Tax=Picea glauca TaxID=3330 RepID=A0A101M3W3_PICGL|nr:hypothetical protein ABT39_MTgene267 [Picea glauca]